LHPQDGLDKVMLKNGLGNGASVSTHAQMEAAVVWMQTQTQYSAYFPASSRRRREGGGA
jgi:hypothetical protein